MGGMAATAAYYLIAAKPIPGVNPVGLSGVGLLIGAVTLGLGTAVGLLPVHIATTDVPLLGLTVSVWIPPFLAGVVATAIPYVSSLTGSRILGSRLASFMGLLEVVAATLYAWLLLGEQLTLLQLAGGGLILAGIACVHADPGRAPSVDQSAPGDDLSLGTLTSSTGIDAPAPLAAEPTQ
jgi:drug/metabolite transporter (DMT)-like permease